jgi:hypothetical protein
MATRRTIKGVLQGFLGTFVSRYSDYEGYWLFGFLVADLDRLNIDLLAQKQLSTEKTPQAMTVALARTKFREQAIKATVSFEMIREAAIEILKLPGIQHGFIGHSARDGCGVLFRVTATMDNGKTYERETVVFVAPHDASVEIRSVRRGSSSDA